MAGATWIKTYAQALAGLGYTDELAAFTEKFKFGNQGTLPCEKCWYLSVMMYGKMGTLAVHEVAGDCPLLISEEAMTRLGVVLRLRATRTWRFPVKRWSFIRGVPTPLCDCCDGQELDGKCSA